MNPIKQSFEKLTPDECSRQDMLAQIRKKSTPTSTRTTKKVVVSICLVCTLLVACGTTIAFNKDVLLQKIQLIFKDNPQSVQNLQHSWDTSQYHIELLKASAGKKSVNVYYSLTNKATNPPLDWYQNFDVMITPTDEQEQKNKSIVCSNFLLEYNEKEQTAICVAACYYRNDLVETDFSVQVSSTAQNTQTKIVGQQATFELEFAQDLFIQGMIDTNLYVANIYISPICMLVQTNFKPEYRDLAGKYSSLENENAIFNMMADTALILKDGTRIRLTAHNYVTNYYEGDYIVQFEKAIDVSDCKAIEINGQTYPLT